jgi:tetratricopeptide (TPR) repeat protein
MTQETTNWVPGLIVLAVGFIAAALYLLLSRGKGAPADARDGVREDLERRYQGLIEQLKELKADQHNLSPERYEAERTRLEQEAVAALRARDAHQRQAPVTPLDSPAPAAAPASRSLLSPQLQGAVWGGCVVLFFVGLGYLIVSEQRPREDGEATGRIPPGMQASPQQQQPEGGDDLAEAWERLKADSTDLETASLLSHELIRRQQFEQAALVTERGLAVDPFHVELRVHRGVLQATRGDLEGAEKELARLVDTYPDAQEALLFLGALSMRKGDRAKALEHFERFAVEVPSGQHPPQLLAAIAQLRQETGR